jgi:methylenetetrahydrofolate dehydrogenase (NADP+)/methenyltetrahydrofolate cyclohydrolase
MATIIDGKSLGLKIRQLVAKEVENLHALVGRKPGLAVILVGDSAASSIYVNMKEKACNEVNFNSYVYRLDNSTTTDNLLELIDRLNSDNNIDGILVQLPLLSHIDEKQVLYRVDPLKDVDGFHPFNVGLLHLGENTLFPCTPHGILKIFDEYSVELAGKNAVVVGRSNIVGKPMASLLLRRNATVTICHSRTKDVASICRSADIIVAAVGIPRYITSEFVADGAIVIDVGINRVDGKLVGDVDYDNVVNKCSLITPVPGGVGPMTIAMLMYNTLMAYKKRNHIE